jgi:hypothetical protein
MQPPAPQPVLVNVPQQQDSLSKVLIACLIVVLIMVVGFIAICCLCIGFSLLTYNSSGSGILQNLEATMTAIP